MPKRKRDEQQHGPPEALRIQLDLGTKKLAHSLKLARGIERQKLGRRQKDALAQQLDSASNNTNARIEAEIGALKRLDVQQAAAHHLHKTLLRIKSIANTGALPSAPQDRPATPLDAATANITARLYNAKLVKDALAATIQGVRQALGLDDPASVAKKAKIKSTPLAEPVELADDEEWRGFSDDLSGSASGTAADEIDSADDSDDFAALDARVAFSSEDDDDDEDDGFDVDGLRDQSAAQLKRDLAQAAANPDSLPGRHDYTDESSDTAAIDPGRPYSSIASAEYPLNSVDVTKGLMHAHIDSTLPRAPNVASNGASAIDIEIGPPTNRTSPTDSENDPDELRKASIILKPTASAFLPSLTMGGYWSGSEGDEPEDIEEHVAPRKNRRGQRARQAIAEAKFGAAAKHVVEGRPANKPKDARDAGWDMKRGATNSEDMRGYKGMDRKERRSRMEGGRKAGASGGNAIPIASGKSAVSAGAAHTFERPTEVKPKRDDTGPLHPSWEAKRKAKAATGKIVPFQGKKITFD